MANPREAGSRERCEEGWRKSGVIPSHRFLADFFRPNPDGVLDWEHKNFSIADFAGLGCADHNADGLIDHFVSQNDFHLHLRQEIDRVFASAINLSVALLAPEALHFRHRHTLDA